MLDSTRSPLTDPANGEISGCPTPVAWFEASRRRGRPGRMRGPASSARPGPADADGHDDELASTRALGTEGDVSRTIAWTVARVEAHRSSRGSSRMIPRSRPRHPLIVMVWVRRRGLDLRRSRAAPTSRPLKLARRHGEPRQTCHADDGAVTRRPELEDMVPVRTGDRRRQVWRPRNGGAPPSAPSCQSECFAAGSIRSTRVRRQLDARSPR